MVDVVSPVEETWLVGNVPVGEDGIVPEIVDDFSDEAPLLEGEREDVDERLDSLVESAVVISSCDEFGGAAVDRGGTDVGSAGSVVTGAEVGLGRSGESFTVDDILFDTPSNSSIYLEASDDEPDPKRPPIVLISPLAPSMEELSESLTEFGMSEPAEARSDPRESSSAGS